MSLRRWIRVIHRDVGYILTGLTVIYCISGIAVNHASEWNPNYVIEKSTTQLKLSDEEKFSTSTMVQAIVKKIGGDIKIKNSFRPDSTSVNIFTQDYKIYYDLQTELLTKEEVRGRPIIKETNFLHLNTGKKLWTWVADAFAVGLIFLAISGLFMVKGKNGMKWRGTWLTLAGILIPIIFLLLYFY